MQRGMYHAKCHAYYIVRYTNYKLTFFVEYHAQYHAKYHVEYHAQKKFPKKYHANATQMPRWKDGKK